MSIEAIKLVLKHSKAKGAARLVLVALAAHCNQKRGDLRCWPSLRVLQNETRLNKANVCRALKHLHEEIGEIRRERSSGGRRKRSEYLITVSEKLSRSDNDKLSLSDNDKLSRSDTVSENKLSRSDNGNGVIARHAPNKKGNKNKDSDPAGLSARVFHWPRDKDPTKPTPLPPTAKKPTRPDPAAPEATFDRFYHVYPRHVAKADALKAWLKLDPDADLIAKIMAAAEHYRTEKEDCEQRFILYPANWLNKRRWEDEPDGGDAAPEAEDIGNGWVEIKSLNIKMMRKEYERMYGRAAV